MELVRAGRQIALVLLAALLAACEPPAPGLGSLSAPIVGGSADPAHPAVGALVGDALCTATLITPKLVLTAAHCFTSHSFDTFRLGSGIDAPLRSISLQTCISNPAFTKKSIGGAARPVHDVAVCVLAQPVADVAPLPMRTASMIPAEGADIAFVGFGASSSGGGGLGTKRSVVVEVASVGAEGFWNLVEGVPAKNTCIGDSGGPGLIVSGGVEQVAGVVSAGDSACLQNGWNMRVELELPWIRSMVETYDPGAIDFGACPDGACSGGETSLSCPADCGETSNPLWKPCSSPTDCDQDTVCAMFSFGNFCTLMCPQPGSASTCPAPFRCSPVTGGGGVCTPGTGAKCGNGTCDPSESGDTCSWDCHAGFLDACPTANLCATGLSCVPWTDGASRCAQPCASPGTPDGCPAGFECGSVPGATGPVCVEAPEAPEPEPEVDDDARETVGVGDTCSGCGDDGATTPDAGGEEEGGGGERIVDGEGGCHAGSGSGAGGFLAMAAAALLLARRRRAGSR